MINPNNRDNLYQAIIDKYIQLYSEAGFIDRYHASCIKLISDSYDIQTIDGHQFVNNMLIPNNPNKANAEIFTLIRKSYHPLEQ
jgi:hypothetical protein